MQLPGRLRATTLGDLLGGLHRAGATGTLELIEDRGRAHRVHVSQGKVVAVELDGAAPSLAEILRRERAADDDVLRRSLLRAMASRRLHGEVLVEEFHLSPSIVGAALRRQVLARLAALEQNADARISFRVAIRPPRGALHAMPLEAREFLYGRRRARERGPSRSGPVNDPPRGREPFEVVDDAESSASSAWQVLGLPPGADADSIKRAYRRLARATHPDLHPGASADEKRALEVRFAAITEAYRALVA
jgi:DnaJ-domain-containing protein 1